MGFPNEVRHMEISIPVFAIPLNLPKGVFRKLRIRPMLPRTN